jgi:ribosomal protein L37AE/L43A
MLYGIQCHECGEDIDIRRVALGYYKCLECGEQSARKVKHTIVPMNKSNYIPITDLSILKQLNPKRT